MNIPIRIKIAAALLAAALNYTLSAQVVFDAAADFSVEKGNPNGVWSYGWTPPDFSNFHEYKIVFSNITQEIALVGWARAIDGYSFCPHVWINQGPPLVGVPTGWLSLHPGPGDPGPGNEASVLRWTAPDSSSVRIQGQFLPGNFGFMHVAVRVAGLTVWEADDSGQFDLTGIVSTGDSVDFAVLGGYEGGDTALGATITLTLPATNQPPIITSQPSNQELLGGTTLDLSVRTFGAEPLGYLWQHNDVPLSDSGRISGTTTNHLQITGVKAEDVGTYAVIVSNSYGSTSSSPAVVTIVFKPPEITTQPTDQTVPSGSTVSLSVVATGSLPMTYQWQRNDADLSDGGQVSGAKTPTLTIAAVGIEDVGVYSVVVTNTFGDATSQPVALNVVMAPPRITTQPQSQAAALGSAVSLEVQATGSQPLSFQWQFNGVDIADGPRVSGSRTSMLQITNLGMNDLGSYSVKVSNALGWVRSAPVSLTTWSAILSWTIEGSQFLISWSDTGKGMTLQRATSLSNPTWENIADSQGTNRMSLQMTEAAAFFRLAMGSPSERLVWIPPGTFVMGSPTNEVDRFDVEGPQMAVTISRGFWMGKYEVTQSEYLAVIRSNPSYFNTNNGYAEDLSRPVDSVAWIDVTNYCAQLTQREQAAGRISANWVYRLPTEAEWEYACRAGTSTRLFYGDDPGYTELGNYAWHVDHDGQTHPVGQKLPNPWGLYDMYGNVWEWCHDWYGPRYPGGAAVDPQGPAVECQEPIWGSHSRVLRGGSWHDWVGGLSGYRSALRGAGLPDGGEYDFGFRVVLAPGQP